MASTVYFIGAGLTKSLECGLPVPLMMDFVQVMAEYIDIPPVLTALVLMELADVYESTCDACKRSARQLEGNVPTASQDQRVHFAELVKSRKMESIERLLDRASSINPRNAWASTMPTYFRYAINQVFSRIGWGLRLDVLKHFLDRRFKDKGSTHVFISFNYDLALDRSIECSSDRVWQPRDGYGFEFPFYITMD